MSRHSRMLRTQENNCNLPAPCRLLTIASIASLSVGCSPSEPPAERRTVDDAALSDNSQGENWLAFGRTYNEQRFSPLTQINDSNVGELAVDWFIDLPSDRDLSSTPLVVDGVLYFVGSMNVVRALDATSGEMLWTYDPRVREFADRIRAGWDRSRGISFWNDKVYVATWDGRLIALDAATGQPVWTTQTIDPDLPMYITGVPKVFKGKVLVGNGGTEHGPSRGYVTAYDAETGEQAWRFWIVPGNPADGFENEAMRMAAATWTGEWWLHGGGGNAWHGITYDAELDQLYIGTGNGSPWNQKIRSPGGGDNLFLCSIVALNPDTGEYLWHYQTVPGETWDFNSNMDIVLADLTIDGRERQVMLHAPKNGFFYVIDRTNGKVISAEPFVATTWASHIDLATGRPVENPAARYEDGQELVTPGPTGGHNWHAMSFNPQTGLAYYPSGSQRLQLRRRRFRSCDVAQQELDRRHGRCVPSRRFVPRGWTLQYASGLGSGAPAVGVGDPAAGTRHQPGYHDHGRQPGLSGPCRRRVCGVPRGYRRGALAHGARARHSSTTDDLFSRRPPVRGVVGRLGRRWGQGPGSRGTGLGLWRSHPSTRRVFSRGQQ